MSTSMRPSVLASTEHALPPPAAAREHTPSPDVSATRRRDLRYRATLIGAIAFALVAVAVLDRAVSPRGADALPLWVICLAGVGAAGVSLLLGRAAFRAGPDAHAHDATARH